MVDKVFSVLSNGFAIASAKCTDNDHLWFGADNYKNREHRATVPNGEL